MKIEIINPKKGEKMESELNEISINGVEYVRKSMVRKDAESFDGMPYVIVRTYSAGVFAGYLKSRTGKESVLVKARRLWYWDGAASLSQLSQEGTKKPQNCKFPCEVPFVELMETIEVLPVSAVAQKSIEGVNLWQM